jgi:hypothetical protein
MAKASSFWTKEQRDWLKKRMLEEEAKLDRALNDRELNDIENELQRHVDFSDESDYTKRFSVPLGSNQ